MTETEFEKLFREQFNILTNLAITVVKDEDNAKDIVQQVFIKLWQKKDDLQIRGPLVPYLCKAVINTAINEFSKTKKTVYLDKSPELKNISSEDEDMHSHLEKIEIQVRNAIETLPPVCRKVFSLSRFTDLSNKEIASELNISVKAVEKHISKAIKTLRILLKPLLNSNLLWILFFSLNFYIHEVGLWIFILSINNYILC